MALSLVDRAINGALSLSERTGLFSASANRLVINRIVGTARFRPHPFSTVHDYSSWRGLSDRTYSARHLPGRAPTDLPPVAEVVELFRRPEGQARLCPKSTLLFPAFAQYLTDGFIRTSTDDSLPDRLKRNTSNHEIDLCPLYGRTLAQTEILRERSADPARRGRLRSQTLGGEEWAPFLYRDGRIAPEFEDLDRPLGLTGARGPDDPEGPDPARRDALFAFGGDRANSVPQVAMMNTLFLREHNRLAGRIAAAEPGWDDDRVFETARNTLIVLFIKLVVEEYINHITPLPFTLRADPGVAWTAPWNRANWITTEFSLLYRWHALVPDRIEWGGETHPLAALFMNNQPLLRAGLRASALSLGAQRACELGPMNTSDALLAIEKASVEQGRFCGLAPYADYRDYVRLPRPQSFADISSRPEVQARLQALYGAPEAVEFFPGLFCEDRATDSPLPGLILRMVAVDAFSQALTNPLLSPHLFNEATFSRAGWEAVNAPVRLADLVARNTPDGPPLDAVRMTRREWRREG